MMRAVLVLVALVAAFGQLPEERRLRQTDHVAAGHEVKSNETEPETERAVETERTDGTDEAHPDGVRVHEFEEERMVRDEEGALLKVPNTVAGACILFTALAYIWFVCGFAGLFTVKDGYLNLGASKPLLPWYYWLAAFLYWVAMPLSMLYISANADCQGGPPDVGYLVFGVFLTVHIILVIVAMCQHPTPPGACDCSKGFFLSGPLLIFFMILDHMDMATDAMFVGTAAACSPMIENAYVQSWAAIPVIGAELKFTIEALSFTGLALFAFVVMAYLPQLVGLTPFFALCSTLVCSSLMLLTLHQSWIWGVVVTALICIALGLGGVFRKQWQVWKDANADDEKTLGLFACMGIFEQLLSQGQQNERLLFVTMTKLVFENLFQLWLQSSFFALTFKFTGPEARMKTVLSMAIGLLVLASKVPGLITELRTGPNQVNLFAGFTCGTFIAWILLLVVIFYAIVIVWITLKIVMAYQCDSHVWNLTLHVWSLNDGCLP